MLAGNLLIKISTNVAEMQADFAKTTRIVENAASAMKTAVLGVGTAMGALGAGMVFEKWVDAVKEAEQSTRAVEAVLRSTNGVAGMTQKGVDNLADSLSKMSGIDDDVIEGAEALMLTFTRVGKDVFPAAQKAALDMSVALKTDLNSATMLVGKALNDPIKGMTALTKSGVSFTAGQKAVIKSLEDTGHHAEAQAMIIKELQTEFGGAAAAARDTLGGALTALGTNVEALTEQLGGPDGLRWGVELVNTVVIEMQTQLAAVQKYFESGQAATSDWGQALQKTGAFLGQLASTGFDALKGSLNEVIAGIISFGQICVDMGKTASETFQLMAQTAQLAGKIIVDALGMIGVKIDFGPLAKGWDDYWKSFGVKLKKETSSTAKDYIGNFFKPIGDEWNKLAAQTDKNIKQMHDAAKNAGKQKIETNENVDLGETKAQKAAREKALKQHETELKNVREILGGYQLGTEELANQLNKHQEMNELLKAQQAILKNEHLTVTEQNKALGELFKLEQDRLAVRKQLAVSKETESLEKMLANIKESNAELVNKNNGQEVLNQRLAIEKQIRDTVKVGMAETKELQDQIRAAVEETIKIQQNQKYEEERKALQEITKDWEGQRDAALAKLNGQEKLLPLLESEKKINEQINKLQEQYKNQGRDDLVAQLEQDRASALSTNREYFNQTQQINEAIKSQGELVEKIKASNVGYKEKVVELGKALTAGAINVEQYNDAVKDLQKDQSKVSDNAKDFAKTLTTGFEKLVSSTKNFKQNLVDLGKELIKLVAQKALFEPLQRGLENMFSGGGLPGLAQGGGIFGMLPKMPLIGGLFGGGQNQPNPYTNQGANGYGLGGGYNPYAPGYTANNPYAPYTGGGMGLPMMPAAPFNVQQGGGFNPLSMLMTMFGGKLPGFANGGYLPPGQFGIAGERGAELIYGGARGATVMPNMYGGANPFGSQMGGFQPYFGGLRGGPGGVASSWNGGYQFSGLGGATPTYGTGAGTFGQPNYGNQNGWTYQQHAEVMSRTFRDMEQKAADDFRNGRIQNASEVTSNRYWSNFYGGEAMTGRPISRLSVDPVSIDWAQYNSMGGSQYVDSASRQRDAQMFGAARQSEMWRGFTASPNPFATNFGSAGGGDIGPSNLSSWSRGSSFAGGGYMPTMPTSNLGGSMSSMYGQGLGGMTGGYVQDVNQGMGPMRDWQSAVARFSTSDGNVSPSWQDIASFNVPANGRPGGWQNTNNLPAGWGVKLDGSLGPMGDWAHPQSVLGNLQGWGDHVNQNPYFADQNRPWQLGPNSWSNPNTGWYNGGMSNIAGAVGGGLGIGIRSLFGFANGGKHIPDGKPILVGEEGPELVHTKRPTSISSNRNLRDVLGGAGGAPNVSVKNYTATSNTDTKVVSTPRGLEIVITETMTNQLKSNSNFRGAFGAATGTRLPTVKHS